MKLNVFLSGRIFFKKSTSTCARQGGAGHFVFFSLHACISDTCFLFHCAFFMCFPLRHSVFQRCTFFCNTRMEMQLHGIHDMIEFLVVHPALCVYPHAHGIYIAFTIFLIFYSCASCAVWLSARACMAIHIFLSFSLCILRGVVIRTRMHGIHLHDSF